uniref:Uncharacterized protein n=1 Tax=Arundo donax TaxID=35708 RepID=A0A0A9EA16_ARUDO
MTSVIIKLMWPATFSRLADVFCIVHLKLQFAWLTCWRY